MVTALTSARSQFGQGVTGRRPWSLGLSMLGSSAYCSRDGYGFGRSDVMDQLRVVLVHAPDVSARTAIVRESRVLARERQIFGGILPTRRTGRSVEQLIVSRTERTSSPTSDLRHVARRLDSFVSRSRGKRSLSSAVEDYRRSRPVDRTYTCQGWVWRTRSDLVLCESGDSGRGVRLEGRMDGAVLVARWHSWTVAMTAAAIIPP